MLHEILRNESQGSWGSCMKHILLIQLARFGDLVQTGRLIKSLEACGQVHLCVDVSLKELAHCLYPQSIVHALPAHGAPKENMGALHAAMQALASQNFSAVYNLNYSPLNISIARLFTPEIVVGYAVEQGQVVRSSWVQKAFRWTQNRHISPINLVDFWAHFHGKPCAPELVNPVAQGQGRGIGVVLAGRESRRSLPPTVLAPVVRTFFESLGGPNIYFLGSEAELPLARQLKKLLPPSIQSRIQDYCGKTSWQGLMDAVQGLDALISPDTGTMHLGARLGVPVHAFFLSSAWCHETGPYGQGHTVWQSVLSCTPCLESRPCVLDTKCLQDFMQPTFFRALTALLQQRTLPVVEGKDIPQSLTCQTSYLDALGSTWRVQRGQDSHEAQRQALRGVVAEYCHCPLSESMLGHTPEHTSEQAPEHMVGQTVDASMVQYFYEEADWMLREPKTSVRALSREMK